MKYGKVLTYKDLEEAKKLIGKKVVAGDVLYVITENPKTRDISVLESIDCKDEWPFVTSGSDYQFIREIIEEEPKYRPYKSMDEMIQDFKERFKDYPESKFKNPLIWLRAMANPDNVFQLTDFEFRLNESFELHQEYVYDLDGSPCGKRED